MWQIALLFAKSDEDPLVAENLVRAFGNAHNCKVSRCEPPLYTFYGEKEDLQNLARAYVDDDKTSKWFFEANASELQYSEDVNEDTDEDSEILNTNVDLSEVYESGMEVGEVISLAKGSEGCPVIIEVDGTLYPASSVEFNLDSKGRYAVIIKT